MYKNLFKKDYIDLFFIVVIIFFVRNFIVEPFRVPSGSMKPTLLVGDFIFAYKFAYTVKLPFINKYIDISNPCRGDVLIFYKNNIRYVKRLIGLPNDILIYKNKTLYLNRIKIKKKRLVCSLNKKKEFEMKCVMMEYLNSCKEYKIKLLKNDLMQYNNYEFFNKKVYYSSYFVLGDNRDNSEDSRVYGMIDKFKIKGKVIRKWISFDIKHLDIRWNRLFKVIR